MSCYDLINQLTISLQQSEIKINRLTIKAPTSLIDYHIYNDNVYKTFGPHCQENINDLLKDYEIQRQVVDQYDVSKNVTFKETMLTYTKK